MTVITPALVYTSTVPCLSLTARMKITFCMIARMLCGPRRQRKNNCSCWLGEKVPYHQWKNLVFFGASFRYGISRYAGSRCLCGLR